MLFRFSLYGFLKNQRYFEVFLWLALLERGLGFTQIGVLVGVQALCVNLFEIPSGALADVAGRRRTMVAAFVAYLVALVGLALGQTMLPLVAAMTLWGLGDAFRSGTHKAMIFDWLRSEGRQDEKVQVYGYTRSWSKIGSAVAVVVGAAVVGLTDGYDWIFWLTLVPYVANTVNLATYPSLLDGERRPVQLAAVATHLVEAARHVWSTPALRRLVGEGMVYKSTFKVTKDYLQPLLQTAAVALPVGLALADAQRTAVLVGVVYTLLFLLGAMTSRQSHRLRDWAGSNEAAARRLWWLTGGVFVAMTAGLVVGVDPLAVAAFIAFAGFRNVWRPILVSRFDDHGLPQFGATILSVEAQAGAIGVALLAPALGAVVDAMSGTSPTLWPVGAMGCVGVVAVLLLTGHSEQKGRAAPGPLSGA